MKVCFLKKVKDRIVSGWPTNSSYTYIVCSGWLALILISFFRVSPSQKPWKLQLPFGIELNWRNRKSKLLLLSSHKWLQSLYIILISPGHKHSLKALGHSDCPIVVIKHERRRKNQGTSKFYEFHGWEPPDVESNVFLLPVKAFPRVIHFPKKSVTPPKIGFINVFSHASYDQSLLWLAWSFTLRLVLHLGNEIAVLEHQGASWWSWLNPFFILWTWFWAK